MRIVFVASSASKNVNEKIKTQTFSPPFVGGYMLFGQLPKGFDDRLIMDCGILYYRYLVGTGLKLRKNC